MRAIEKDTNIDGKLYSLLHTIAGHVGSDGATTHVSRAYLAHALCCSERTVTRLMRHAQIAGHLEVEARSSREGRRNNRLRLLVEPVRTNAEVLGAASAEVHELPVTDKSSAPSGPHPRNPFHTNKGKRR